MSKTGSLDGTLREIASLASFLVVLVCNVAVACYGYGYLIDEPRLDSDVTQSKVRQAHMVLGVVGGLIYSCSLCPPVEEASTPGEHPMIYCA